MTKREAKARKEAWARAVNEGRVVNFDYGKTLREYLTVEEANKAVEDALKAGMPAKVVL